MRLTATLTSLFYIATAAAAISAGYLVAGKVQLALLLILAPIGWLAWRSPGLAALILVLAIEELQSSVVNGILYAPLLTAGSEIYFTRIGPFVLLFPIALILAGRSAFIAWPTARRLTVLWVSVSVVVIMSLITAAQTRDTRRIPLILIDVLTWNQQILMLVAGVLLGVSLSRTRPALVTRLVGLILAYKGGIALFLLATGQGGDVKGADALVESSGLLVYYDSSIAFLAASVLAAQLLTRNRSNWSFWLVAASCLIIVVTSLRRNVWIYFILCLVVGLVVSRSRVRLASRVTLAACAVAVVSSFVATPILSVLNSHLFSAVGTLFGSSGEASTGAHEDDIENGLAYALTKPLLGWGSRSLQLPGFASGSTGRLYVHNEFLEVWLRFGLLGLLGLVMLIALMIVIGWQLLLRARTVLDLTLAYACIGLVIPIGSAPFITTTGRWPLLIGIIFGLAAVLATPRRPSPRSNGSADQAHRPDQEVEVAS